MEGAVFAKVFAEILRTHGLKQGEAAERLGIDQSTLSFWLNGRREPTYAQLQRIISTFHINPARLFQWD